MAAGANTAKGTQLTKLDSTPAVKVQPNEHHGEIRVAYGDYEAAAPGIGLRLSMVRVPNGARILGGEVWWDALGASTRITVGDSNDTDRFMTQCPTSTAKISANADTGRFNDVDGIGYEYTCEKDILISFSDDNPTGTIKLVVEYATD